MSWLKYLKYVAAAAVIIGGAHLAYGALQPSGYRSEIKGSAVEITPYGPADDRPCPDPSGLLREDVRTGETVVLRKAREAAGGGCVYVDDCAPVGTYRYGLAAPFVCRPSSVGTDFFTAVEVKTAPDAGCAPESPAARTPDGRVPWKDYVDVNDVCAHVEIAPEHHSTDSGY